jgi:hypothetical protein
MDYGFEYGNHGVTPHVLLRRLYRDRGEGLAELFRPAVRKPTTVCGAETRAVSVCV